MRTTVDLDPDLLEELKVQAAKLRVSFKDFLNSAIRRGLRVAVQGKGNPYALPVRHLGAVREGINLDKALALADEIETHAAIDELNRHE